MCFLMLVVEVSVVVGDQGALDRRADYGSFADFADPDGNTWVLQERGWAARSA